MLEFINNVIREMQFSGMSMLLTTLVVTTMTRVLAVSELPGPNGAAKFTQYLRVEKQFCSVAVMLAFLIYWGLVIRVGIFTYETIVSLYLWLQA